MLPSATVTTPGLALPHPASPRSALPNQNRLEGDRGELAPQCCRLQPLPDHAALSRAWPCRSRYCLAVTALRAAGKAEALRAAVCNFNHAKPYLTMPSRTEPCLTKTTLKREQQRKPKPPVLPSAAITRPDRTIPHLTSPCHATPYPTPATLQREQQRGLAPSVLPSATGTLPNPAAPGHATPSHTKSHHASLGLTPKDAQLDQATSASMRLRVAVTGSTSASKRPCLGRQSPSPTSLPASPAISSTSRKFNTSGSY